MKLKITIDGKPYDVDVEVEETEASPTPYAPAVFSQPTMVPSMAPPPLASPSGGAADDKVCRSPMVGIIVRILVQEGQKVKQDDPLVVLEAMKMETTITSPNTGKVKAIPVHATESVQSGQVLVEFE
jgi:methylmalonyl-CoA carboxyltransferase small subunit